MLLSSSDITGDTICLVLDLLTYRETHSEIVFQPAGKKQQQ